jgi:hypothetical protein
LVEEKTMAVEKLFVDLIVAPVEKKLVPFDLKNYSFYLPSFLGFIIKRDFFGKNPLKMEILDFLENLRWSRHSRLENKKGLVS